ncbi:MAG: DUF4469 domain-containing protein [Prevotellaceae bacterium]|jgi:hypothetical protein|nr:DUF4469 domain-containing protein [Prevotellaceae bacterium]
MATDFWKVLLRPNLLTKDVDDDYIAIVSTIGHTERREDIAREIVAEGTEFKYETILDILTRADRIICQHIGLGHSVLTGVSHITPRVRGSWTGENAPYNREEHKITVDMTPGSELRDVLKDVGVEVIGMSDAHAFIRTATDSASGKIGTFTPGFDLIIEGNKIKILPEDDETLGVFLVNDAIATATRLQVTQNMPKTLRAHVPAGTPEGEYTLQVVTQFSSGVVLLKEPRTIEYAKKLVYPLPDIK